jgi:hypothetical protein
MVGLDSPMTIATPYARALLLGASLAASAGCGIASRASDSGPGDDGDAGSPGEPTNAADILFVVDDTVDMTGAQSALASALPGFLAALESAAGGRPDLHIGVISTDLGVGPFAIVGCTAIGDGGQLLRRDACPPLAEPYLIDRADGDGGRVINYPDGQLAETLGCMVQLGAVGCGFEQPLEAMRRALDPGSASNAGFVREDAVLAVVVLTNEDDCSVEDTALFDPSQGTIDAPLGPLTSYRCFEFGIQCTPDSRTAVGARSDCETRDASAYLHSVGDYADALRAIKPARRLAVAVIAGPQTPVNVASNASSGFPELTPSCTSPTGTTSAAPAIRLDAFARSFGDDSHVGSICEASPTGSLTAIAELIAARLGGE